VWKGLRKEGPLSPLLSNFVLDELERELEHRGHRFVRYADDCNIYVRSQRAGQRVMDSIRRFITPQLKLKVNDTMRMTLFPTCFLFPALARPAQSRFGRTIDERPNASCG
jgi:retron-type reverse transcriptase